MAGGESRSKYGTQTLTRRRFLARSTAGGFALTTAAVIACGGGEQRKTTATTATGTGAAQASSSTPVARAAGAPTTATAAAGAAQPKRGGTLSWQVNFDTPHLDVHQTASGALHTVIGAAYSQLLKVKVGPEVPPGTQIVAGDLAQSWEQVDDLTVVFHMRQDAKFHNVAPVNGRLCVAQDVAYSFDRQKSLKVNASFLADVAQTQVTDPLTLRVTLTDLNVDALLNISGYPNKVVAHEVVEQYGDLKQPPVIGTGAWMFQEWVPNNVARMRRNPNYFGRDANGNPLPYADAMEELRIADAQTIAAAFRTGRILTFNGAKPDIDSLTKQNPGVQVSTEKTPTNHLVAMARVDKPPTNDVRVRQALLIKGLDRQPIIDTVRFGEGWWTSGIVPPASDWLLPEDEVKKTLAHDVAGAMAQLKAAAFSGWTPSVKDFSTGGFEYGPLAELAQQQLKALNVVAKLDPCDVTCVNTTLSQGTIELWVGTAFTGASVGEDLHVRFATGGSRNTSGLSDPQMDDLIKAQAREKNEARRRDLFNQIQRRNFDLADKIPVYGVVTLLARQPQLRNYFPQWSNFRQPGLFEIAWLDQ